MSDSEDKHRRYRHPFFWGVVAVGLLMFGVYLFATVIVFRYGAVITDYGWESSRRGVDGWYVTSVNVAGPAASRLAPGDRIIAVNNDARIGSVGPIFKTIHPDSTYSIRVKRDDGEQQFTLYGPLKRDYR